MIYFDTTKSGAASHHSGLMRVTTRLVAALGSRAISIRWPELPPSLSRGDWFVTAELFSEAERPGFGAFLESHRCRAAAIYHDAIPLKLPHITWPHSVERHPEYMKRLARFDRVWAVSAASKAELEGFWRWLGVDRTPPVDVINLGADFNSSTRVTNRLLKPDSRPRLLCIGILEPRKNQGFLLDVCEQLWDMAVDFELHLVGRVNPHFGRPIAARVKEVTRRQRQRVVWHTSIDDAALAELYAGARATVFPTIAEGCGLPLIESLWMGVPCVCSDLAVLRENADAGGCVPVPVNDAPTWSAALRRIIADEQYVTELTQAAQTRPLPTWADAANTLAALG